MNAALKAPAIAIVLALSACASTHGLRPTATLMRGEDLAASQTLAVAPLRTDAWPAEAWWQGYGDPQLDTLVSEALTGSPTLRAAAARERIAAAEAGVVGAGRYPEVAADASITRERFAANSLIPPPYAGQWANYSQIEATLSWDLDLWGRHRAEYAAAIGEARAASADAAAARLALAAVVAQQYVELERAYLQRDVAVDTLAQREHILALTRDRNAAGLDSRLELKQTETALPVTREQIAQLDEIIARTRNTLAALLGKGPDRGLTIERPKVATIADVAVPSVLPADLLGRRPDITARRWRVEAATRQIDVARTAFYPNVNLAGAAGYQLLGPTALVTSANRAISLGPAISLPLFDGGRRRANLAARDSEYDLAVEQYNRAVTDALRDVAEQLTAARSVAVQRVEQNLALATAQEAYDLAVLRYREGVGNYLQVLATESELLRQRGLDVELRARALEISIELARALGGGYDENAVAAPTASL